MTHTPALLAMITMLLAMSPATVSAQTSDQPNIILFVSDDHRADVLGCAGHPIVQTPHIDQLAGDGVRYANAFVTTSVCAASRASILTGQYERTHGYTFGTPPLARSRCQESYPWQLRQHGYRTGFVGKFGISVDGGRDTINEMFDSFVPLGRSPYLKTLPDGSTRHVTDITGDKAIEFIRDHPKGTPFCLSVSFNAAHAEDGDLQNHYPYSQDEARHYQDVQMPRPRLDGDLVYDDQPDVLKSSLNRTRFFWRWDTPEKYQHNLRNYFRMLTGLDRNIGRVLEELKARGLEDDTVIIFMGDNGYYMAERGFAGKWSHFDQSLRIPFVVFDPRLPQDRRGQVHSDLTLNIDITPTILELAGLETNSRLPGHSLAPSLRSGAPLDRTGFFCEHRMNHPQLPRWEGYRTARYKYARYLDAPGAPEFLYDLQRDPDELYDLAEDPMQAEILDQMRSLCEEASRRYSEAQPGRETLEKQPN